MENLPDELKREIVKFIPRHDNAQIIHDSRHNLSLNYVRRFRYFENILYHKRIWEELKPTTLGTLFYGDNQKIIRSNVSKGEHIKLRIMGNQSVL